MKRSRYTEEQIAYALKQMDSGIPAIEVCRKMGISEQTFYVWRRKYGGMGATELRKVRMLEEEVRRLKHLVADLSLDEHMLQEVLAKKL
jgi:putative transposase